AAGARAGITARPLSLCYAGRPRAQGLLLGYTAVGEREIARQVEVLARALTAAP
ncbi:MAG: hypothetical protein IRY94_01720, partial [Rhodospirillaceae bacterium]|nr:hypothetical protein [Rhodospirillaceae bacterium]